MIERNGTQIKDILLLGFQGLDYWKVPFLISLFTVYSLTICGNLLLIILVAFHKTLHSPMYRFLAQLSISDVLMSTNIVPNTLAGVFSDGAVMSLSGCITQLYFFGVSGASECFILTAMAYDRYLAICNPLLYPSIMNMTLFRKVSVFCWVMGISFPMVTVLNILTLDFCGPQTIDHFFCDLDPILQLSCSQTSTVKLQVVSLSFLVMVMPMVLTGTSYGCIVQAVLRMSSSIDRHKAFSTCSSHLIVVCIFYGTLIVIYMIPTEGLSLAISKSISLLYTVVTPMVNPIIYSLRNNDVKRAINIFIRGKLI